MKIDNVDTAEIIEQAKKMLKNNSKLSAEFVALFTLLLTMFELVLNRLGRNSKNSSTPPSQDPNREKKTKDKDEAKRKSGGQPGRAGKTLKPVENPDEIIDIPVNRAKLPSGHVYKKVGVTKRQVVEINISRHVKEYRLEIVEDENGKRFTAEAPTGAGRPIQYGNSVKATAVYLSSFQLIPYGRVENYFRDQAQLPISEGSLFNFIEEAFDRLEAFEEIAKNKLRGSRFLHNDETGINIGGSGHWLHAALNDKWTLFMPNKKRGTEAMDAMDILPNFKGVSIHDHWKPYFSYKQCKHSLCNAHHLRELEFVIGASPKHTWGALMQTFLKEAAKAVEDSGGSLSRQEFRHWRTRYRKIIEIGEVENPLPSEEPDKPKKRGKIKKSKERNLLERLRDYEVETLRFMYVSYIPFTNNPGENDIRMTKVQQKISGWFKSYKGAQMFCRIRSYILTSQKHGINATEALNTLFSGKLPDFCTVN